MERWRWRLSCVTLCACGAAQRGKPLRKAWDSHVAWSAAGRGSPLFESDEEEEEEKEEEQQLQPEARGPSVQLARNVSEAAHKPPSPTCRTESS